MIYSGISPHPIMAGAIIVSRLVFLRMPDPEIYIPAGTEMILQVPASAREQRPDSSDATFPRIWQTG